MSESALPPSAPNSLSRSARFERRVIICLIWSVAVICLWVSFGTSSPSTDDATRLVEIRDFLAGQSWFDHTQYRLNPPEGVVTHWSRLVDLPIALLIKTAGTMVPTALAERIAMMIWPAALLAGLLVGISRIAGTLAGNGAACVAVVLAALMAPTLQHYRFGSIHHHNIQIVLIVWSLAFFIDGPRRPVHGALAGLFCALSVAIGQETVPALAALGTIASLRWAFNGKPYAVTTVAFAGSLATGTIVLAAATISPADYFSVHCDTISIAQVGVLAVGGLGLAALAVMPWLTSVSRRLVASFGLAILLAIYTQFVAPHCLGDPYAQLDPKLVDLWLSSVSEARNLWSIAHDLPQQIPVYFGIPLAALLLGIIRCIWEESDRRWNWIAVTAVQLAFVLVSFWQLRGAGGANAVAAALFPAALLRAIPAAEGRPTYFGMTRITALVMLVFNPATLLALGTGATHAFAAPTQMARRIISSGDAGTCQRADDYTPLARLPRGRILAFIDSGPFILMQSEHSVLAAPYHRNQAGNIAMLDMFLGSPDDARIQMERHGIDYVAFCPGAPERYQYASLAPRSLAAALASNEPLRFLERLRLVGTDLAVYRLVH